MCVHTHTMELILSCKKKNEILPFAATWMHAEIIILNKPELDKYHDIYMEVLKENYTNELSHTKQIILQT